MALYSGRVTSSPYVFSVMEMDLCFRCMYAIAGLTFRNFMNTKGCRITFYSSSESQRAVMTPVMALALRAIDNENVSNLDQ